ncbi:MAG: FAD-dependent monooxygenase [Hyphomicrobiaceae bacterium]
MPDSGLKLDVAIVGGSFAGLALAIALDRCFGSDVKVAIVERRDVDRAAPSAPDPRAFAVAEGSRLLLEALGVWWRVAADAQPVTGIDITDSSLEAVSRPVLLSYDNCVEGVAQSHIVDAGRLEAALLASARACPGVGWIAPGELRSMDATASFARLEVDGFGTLSARLVVAADGAGSKLRNLSGIGVTRLAFQQTGIVTTVAHEKPHEGRAVQHFLPAGPFAMLPLKGDRCCITWSEDSARAREILALPDDLFLEEVQQRAGWHWGEMQLVGPRRSWPLEGMLAREIVRGRVALIGDAARSVHPIAGQGLNLGLRDVAALAEAIADGLRLGLDAGDATLLALYQSWRRFDNVQSSAAFGTLNGLFSSDSSLLRSVRDAGLGLVDRLDGLKALLVSEAAGHVGDVPRLLHGQLP